MANNWKTVKYLKTDENKYLYDLILPEPLASWDVFDYWEKKRIESMALNLNKDDVVFDIGAEYGWMSVVLAKMANVFLIEPTKEFWPNIYQIWKRNVEFEPVGCFSGLIGRKTNIDVCPDFSQFPAESKGKIFKYMKYQYIWDHEDDINIISLDDLVNKSKIRPTALSIDVEGGELDVLVGGIKTLKKKMKVWVSVHPDLLEKHYKKSESDVHDFMLSLGYKKTYLGQDHEKHYLYVN